MKKYQYFLILAFSTILINSCSKDYSYEGGLYRKCVGCTYLPLCDSSVFVYVDSSAAGVDTLSGAVSIGNDTTIGGITYSNVSGYTAFSQGLLYNCSNEDYKTLLSLSELGFNADSIVQVLLQTLQIPLPPGTIQIPDQLQTSFLKANLPVGSTWTDTIYNLSMPPFLTITAGLDYQIEEKGISRTVFQTSYSNVIHVSATINVASSLGPIPVPAFNIDYYFAPDVGIIEMQVSNNGVVESVLKLYSFQL